MEAKDSPYVYIGKQTLEITAMVSLEEIWNTTVIQTPIGTRHYCYIPPSMDCTQPSYFIWNDCFGNKGRREIFNVMNAAKPVLGNYAPRAEAAMNQIHRKLRYDYHYPVETFP